MLANMTLDGLEAAVLASTGGSERAHRRAKLNVIRYADDFVVTGASRDVPESVVLPAVRRFMATRGLELSEEKTRITHITEGFDFLGQTVRKYGRQCLTKPAKKSITSLLAKVREIIKGNATATQAALIRLLNPVIRGWAVYHRHSAAKTTFNRVDNFIWHMLWRWAKRRHPAKGARWIEKRYFRTIGNRNGDFATKGSADGKTIGLRLFRTMTVAITRHIKVPAAANPFDPAWTSNLDRRRASKRSVKLFGASLWC
ncbi:group II intron maturase-specific domain-containing protein [Castellaniella sp. WN]